MNKLNLSLCLFVLFLSCWTLAQESIEQRFPTPYGFKRTTEATNSYGYYLRNLPLKPSGSQVTLYNGQTKRNAGVYAAVVDLPIGKRNLHQCADAVMRLRAEYLYGQKRYEDIHFNFTNGFRVDYDLWRKGKRISVSGNQSKWIGSEKAIDNSYPTFWKYLEIIFAYAGTLSLEKELQPVQISDMKIGDVFIQGGSPGHAIVVVDMAVNARTQKKIFLLAQSYMPAQELQILQNPENESSSWYALDFGETLYTPEWTFSKNDLKRFRN